MNRYPNTLASQTPKKANMKSIAWPKRMPHHFTIQERCVNRLRAKDKAPPECWQSLAKRLLFVGEVEVANAPYPNPSPAKLVPRTTS
jgi:hypothetical protein